MSFRKIPHASLTAIAVASMLVGCATGAGSDAPIANCKTASCYINAVSGAQWAAAENSAITVTFDKVDNTGAPTDYVYKSNQWTDPARKTLVFEAGKPYVLKFVNAFSALNNTPGGDAEHYFTSPEFYKSIVVHKVTTPTATYKTPLLNDFELNAPAHNSNKDTEGAIYFIPVKTGIFSAVCKEGKHSDSAKRHGMVATLQITGKSDLEVDFEIPKDFPEALGSPSNKLKGINYASSDKQPDYWREVLLQQKEGKFSMSPLVLQGNTEQPNYLGSVVRFKKSSDQTDSLTLNTSLFKSMALRKIHDKHAQIKPYLISSIEFAPGSSQTNPVNATKPGTGEVDLFFVPTQKGAFDLHFAAGNSQRVSTASAVVR